jgi:NAD(P)-dependent dehydrogenase (short-subunit alcohol dehydrogenase family)
MARVLITGSNSGFGMLATLSLARAGHPVIATMRDLAKGDELRKLAADEDLPVETRRLDVGDPASIVEAMKDPAELDVVVNNAGFEVQSSVAMLDDDLLRRQLDTNVLGPMRVVRAVLPAWTARGSGTIVNVSSVAGIVGVPFGGAYAASKHALEALSESLHFEVGQNGLRVRLVEPGRFETGFADKMVHPEGWDGSPDAARCGRFREAMGKLQPPDAPEPDPQDVADAIVRAATDPDAPFRRFVGADAELVSGVKRSMSLEEFEATMRATLDWHE